MNLINLFNNYSAFSLSFKILLKIIIDTIFLIVYNTLVTWFKEIVKFDFSDYDIGLSNKVGFFP